MRFRLKGNAAPHDHHGEQIRPGEVVESSYDFTKAWPHKFERVDQSAGYTVVRSDPVVALEEDPSVEGSPHGVEVTSAFPTVRKEGFRVFRRGGFFHVFEPGVDGPINKKGLRKKQVVSFVRDLLEEE